MVFGRPPICVLRIGDFYNTKIVVDSVNISYDPLQWDLNPEGIGVQPMLAKVTMSFKFIGGSSLGGPIKQLQNAVSYNFYANTGVYQPWKYTEKIIDQKQRFIYGAFMSPEDAETAYGNVNSSLGVVQDVSVKQNLESVNTTSVGVNTPISSTATTQISNSQPIPPPTSSSGNPPTANVSTDMERLTMLAEKVGPNIQLIFGRKETSDTLALNNDYTITSVNITALYDDNNSVKNIPIGETILASSLNTTIDVFVNPPINTTIDVYSVAAYFSNNIDYKNAALKI
jgi:viroplasmin and RNaseH domain-containing protein